MKETELKKLYARSGNRCAFPDCHIALVPEARGDDQVVLGEAAHIVAESDKGPRGRSELTLEQRNLASNRILLCARHHQLIDAKPETYTTDRLHAIKADHETWVGDRLTTEDPPIVVAFQRDQIHSSMLEVEHLPRYLFSAPCDLDFGQVIERLDAAGGQITPFVLKEGALIAFQDLRIAVGPFGRVISASEVSRVAIADYLGDPDKARWVVDLLNRAISRYCASRGLKFDPKHRRYYFPQSEPGQSRKVRYRGLNSKSATRSVVWQPIRKATGEARAYWLHRGVSLQFLRVGDSKWVLAIRPELRVTKDGVSPLDSEKIGARVTRRKSRLFNYDLLNEVNFWRDYLSASRPRITLEFGSPGQFARIPTRFLSCDVEWPGLPAEHDMPFANVEYLDDLFSWGEALEADDDELEDGEEGEADEEQVDVVASGVGIDS